MRRLKSAWRAQLFLSVHGTIESHFTDSLSSVASAKIAEHC